MCSERVFVLRSVRVLYEKKGRMKFISHLDMTRLMTRIIRKSKLPVWYTEGFNKRVYVSFALPLSLGFESDYEVLDFKLEDDTFSLDSIPEILNKASVDGLKFFECFEAQKKSCEVTFADFVITFYDNKSLIKPLEKFLKSDSILCEKRTKKGDIKEFDFKEVAKKIEIDKTKENTKLLLTLPAGNNGNINPELLISKFFENAEEYYCYSVLKTMIYDGLMQPFR